MSPGLRGYRKHRKDITKRKKRGGKEKKKKKRSRHTNTRALTTSTTATYTTLPSCTVELRKERKKQGGKGEGML